MSRRAGSPGSTARLLVVTLCAAFVVVVTGGVHALTLRVGTSVFAASPTTALVLGLLTAGFAVVVGVVAGSVMANITTVVVAGQVHQIALRRLLGSPVRAERRRLVGEALRTSAVGIMIGLAVGEAASWVLVRHAAPPLLCVGPLALVLALSAWSTWRGSRAVLAVQPVHALGAADLQLGGVTGSRRLDAVTALLLIAAVALLATAALAGRVTPYALVPGLLGGTALAVGLVRGAPALAPAWLRLLDRVTPATFASRMASRRLQEHAARTGRTAVGIVVAVGVVTMFVVGTASFQASIAAAYRGTSFDAPAQDLLGTILRTVVPMICLITLVAAVGLVSTVSLDTRLRTRETALQRVLGQSAGSVRAVALQEAGRLALGSVVTGLVVGSVVGWVGAQSVIGSVAEIDVARPVVPLGYVGVLLAAGVALTVVAALAPLRPQLATAPVELLDGVGA